MFEWWCRAASHEFRTNFLPSTYMQNTLIYCLPSVWIIRITRIGVLLPNRCAASCVMERWMAAICEYVRRYVREKISDELFRCSFIQLSCCCWNMPHLLVSLRVFSLLQDFIIIRINGSDEVVRVIRLCTVECVCNMQIVFKLLCISTPL